MATPSKVKFKYKLLFKIANVLGFDVDISHPPYDGTYIKLHKPNRTQKLMRKGKLLDKLL